MILRPVRPEVLSDESGAERTPPTDGCCERNRTMCSGDGEAVSSLSYELALLGHGEEISSVTALSLGVVCDAWLVSYKDGSRFVAKTSLGAPPGMFSAEAAGLRTLAASGHVRAARVIAVNERALLLEALEPALATTGAWERLAQDLAGLHRGNVGSRFGWESDGYLGWLPQHNAWASDGHRFFAEHRLLRYLGEPATERALDAADRKALERLCERLAEIVPAMPPVLTHGDLWSGNLVTGPGGRLVVIDPAVSFTWAEVDLSMLWCSPRPEGSNRFFAVYQELNQSPPGWAERMSVLYLREVLSTIAHIGGPGKTIGYLRQVLAPFYAGRG